MTSNPPGLQIRCYDSVTAQTTSIEMRLARQHKVRLLTLVLFNQLCLHAMSFAVQLLGTTGATAAGAVSIFAAGGAAIMLTGSVLASGGTHFGGSLSAVGVPVR